MLTDDSFDKEETTRKSDLANAYQKLYPNVPSPPMFHKLPLQAYTGNYTRSAYGTITIDEKRLYPGRTDRHHLHLALDRDLLAYDIDLEHVFGEHWLATFSGLYSGPVVRKARAEFRIDANGRASEFGIEFDRDVATKLHEKIWFTRQN